jgi:phospholipid/cholesterol/gamma-HCH transport system substrate-binding protein
MSTATARRITGMAAIIAIGATVAAAFLAFRGDFTTRVPVTVVSPRAGLVMYPEARVKMHGVEVGTVSSIEQLPNGQAAIHLAMDPSALQYIPANTLVDITSSTVFGAKFVRLVAPSEPSSATMYAGQVLDARNVTVENKTVFQQLTAVLSKIDPAKFNETLAAMSSALSGRGGRIGQMLTDWDSALAKLNPSLPALQHDLAVSPGIAANYSDAALDLLATVDHSSAISRTVVDEQQNLDALLIGIIGLADIGDTVLTQNRQPLTDALNLFVPTTDLTNTYNAGLYCSLAGMLPLLDNRPLPVPGALVLASFALGVDRYRYPADLPKVAATGGPQCTAGLPRVPYEARPPLVIADVGTNPAKYGNQGILLNSDALKQWLFGPLDGPPRNTAQIGQPG